jgi:hypothetical protein
MWGSARNFQHKKKFNPFLIRKKSDMPCNYTLNRVLVVDSTLIFGDLGYKALAFFFLFSVLNFKLWLLGKWCRVQG